MMDCGSIKMMRPSLIEKLWYFALKSPNQWPSRFGTITWWSTHSPDLSVQTTGSRGVFKACLYTRSQGTFRHKMCCRPWSFLRNPDMLIRVMKNLKHRIGLRRTTGGERVKMLFSIFRSFYADTWTLQDMTYLFLKFQSIVSKSTFFYNSLIFHWNVTLIFSGNYSMFSSQTCAHYFKVLFPSLTNSLWSFQNCKVESFFRVPILHTRSPLFKPAATLTLTFKHLLYTYM